MENKMSDNDVIKAMEFCIEHKADCTGCPFESDAKKCVWLNLEHPLEVINRRNAEIEKLKKALNTDFSFISRRAGGKTQRASEIIKVRVEKIKSDTINEFIERIESLCYIKYNIHTANSFIDDLNKIKKEMLEGQNES